jgi:hypothetical protein
MKNKFKAWIKSIRATIDGEDNYISQTDHIEHFFVSFVVHSPGVSHGFGNMRVALRPEDQGDDMIEKMQMFIVGQTAEQYKDAQVVVLFYRKA